MTIWYVCVKRSDVEHETQNTLTKPYTRAEVMGKICESFNSGLHTTIYDPRDVESGLGAFGDPDEFVVRLDKEWQKETTPAEGEIMPSVRACIDEAYRSEMKASIKTEKLKRGEFYSWLDAADEAQQS